MANGLALGKFGGEFAQGTQTCVGQLQSGLFPRAYFAYTASHVRLWQILLQKSLATLLKNDFGALMRFAVEAIDDGAAPSRPR